VLNSMWEMGGQYSVSYGRSTCCSFVSSSTGVLIAVVLVRGVQSSYAESIRGVGFWVEVGLPRGGAVFVHSALRLGFWIKLCLFYAWHFKSLCSISLPFLPTTLLSTAAQLAAFLSLGVGAKVRRLLGTSWCTCVMVCEKMPS
jgi:hypothetical protein